MIAFSSRWINCFLLFLFVILVTGNTGSYARKPKRCPLNYQNVNTSKNLDLSNTMLELVNKVRNKKKLPPLRFDPDLMVMAQAWTDVMTRDCFCSHVHPKDKSLTLHNRLVMFNRDRIKKGLSALKLDQISENVGFSAETHMKDEDHIRTIFEGFLDSKGHKQNILSKESTIIGIGIARGTYKGIPALFLTQIFGHPSDHPLQFIGSQEL